MSNLFSNLQTWPVELGKANKGDPESAKYLLTLISEAIGNHEVLPAELSLWFAQAVDKLSNDISAEQAFGLQAKRGKKPSLSEDEEELLYATFKTRNGKRHRAETKKKNTTYATISEEFNISPNTAERIIKEHALMEALAKEAIRD